MPKRMVALCNGESTIARALDIRQGLTHDPVMLVAPQFLNNSSIHMVVAAGDGTPAGVIGSIAAAAGQNFRYMGNLLDFSGMVSPPVTFSGTPRDLAISEDFYAVSGDAPHLYVFNRADSGIVSGVATTGLGSVRGVCFSPDGSKLAVCHTTSPYVRVYNTSDWTYINATPGSTIGINPNAICFTADGNHLFVSGYSSPFIAVFNPTTMARTYTGTNYSVIGSSTGGQPSAVSHAQWPTKILYVGENSPCLFELDCATMVTTPFSVTSPAISSGRCITLDAENDAVYLHHGAVVADAARTWTTFKISTKAVTAPDPAMLLIMKSSGQPSSAAVITTTPHRITGTVRDVDNSPAARVVRAYRRSDGRLMAQTVSNAGTGEYDITVYDAGPYDVQFLTEDGELLNDLFYARAIPEAVV